MSSLELFIPNDINSLNRWMDEQKAYILENFSTGGTEIIKDDTNKEVEIPSITEEGKIYANLLANLYQYRSLAYNLLTKSIRKNNWVVYLKNGTRIDGSKYNNWTECFWDDKTKFDSENDIKDIEVNVAGKVQHPQLHPEYKRTGLRKLQFRTKLVGEMDLGPTDMLSPDTHLQHYILKAVYDDITVIKRMYINGDVEVETIKNGNAKLGKKNKNK